jgi:Asp-tRNA(Asn)/Glu-tRNA(Gln) amidotransferase A subunit family amidase
MSSIQADFDILLTACATGEAPVGFATTGIAKLALIWTTMHVPAMSVPVFTGPAGMPIPVYLVGKRSQDREFFAHARWVQRALT